MKKILSVLLALVLLCTAALPALAGSIETGEITSEPVIIVPGYAASPLFLFNEDGSIERQVWGWNIMTGKLLEQVKAHAPQLLLGAGALTLGDVRFLGAALGNAILDLMDDLRCDGNGRSLKRVAPLTNDAALCRWDRIKENYGSEYYSEAAVGNEILDHIPKTQLYNFYADFRCGAAENAARLDAFIQSVKADSGAEKVRLYALSHGGQVSATYLSLYGEKQDVSNALLTVPAIGGSPVAYDLLAEKAAINEETLVYFIENAMILDQNFNWLVRAQQLGFLDDLAAAMLPAAKKAAAGWQSLWDFLPYNRYRKVISAVNASAYAGIIETTTAFHENVMAHFGEALRACRERYGIEVNIIAGTGSPIVTGSREYSDAIISVASATGAAVAPYGKRFANGYTPRGGVCTDAAHSHVSPSMTIDASCAYLPENTWFVEDFFHGMTMNESQTRELALQLLLTDNIETVDSDPEFPQFLVSQNHAHALAAEFENNKTGVIGAADTVLKVTNITKEKTLRIASIAVGGAKVKLQGDYTKYLKPGETASFTVAGAWPKVSNAMVSLDVAFVILGAAAPLNDRVFRFRLENGAPAKYDESAPLCDAHYAPAIDGALSPATVIELKFFGVYDVLRMLYDLCLHLRDQLAAFVRH